MFPVNTWRVCALHKLAHVARLEYLSNVQSCRYPGLLTVVFPLH